MDGFRAEVSITYEKGAECSGEGRGHTLFFFPALSAPSFYLVQISYLVKEIEEFPYMVALFQTKALPFGSTVLVSW